MSPYPFDCLVVASRDAEIDELVVQLLKDGGHRVTAIAGSDLLTCLKASQGPVVVIKNMNAVTSRWNCSPRLMAAAALTRRAGFVLLTMYAEWQGNLAQHLPPQHDITVLPLPTGMAQLTRTVEQVGQRAVRRWEPLSDDTLWLQNSSDLTREPESTWPGTLSAPRRK